MAETDVQTTHPSPRQLYSSSRLFGTDLCSRLISYSVQLINAVGTYMKSYKLITMSDSAGARADLGYRLALLQCGSLKSLIECLRARASNIGIIQSG